MIPFRWWGLTPRDMSGKLIRHWDQAATVSGAATTLQTAWTVPIENAVIISAWGVDARAGAAQTPTFGYLTLTKPAGVAVTFPMNLNRVAGLSTPLVLGDTMTGTWLAGPGDEIKLSATFNAGGVANLALFALEAMMVPRGEVAWL